VPSENFSVPLWFRLVVWLGTWILSLILRGIIFTCRYEYFGYEAEVETRRKHPSAGYATWHRNLLVNMFHGRRRRNGMYSPSCMASRSKDGEWAAGLLHRFGSFRPGLRHQVRQGGPGRIGEPGKGRLRHRPYLRRAQGPGPAMQDGIDNNSRARRRAADPLDLHRLSMLAAQQLGRHHHPQAVLRIVMGMDEDHILIPADADENELERYRKLVEDRLNILAYQVDMYVMDPKKYDSPFKVPVPPDYLGKTGTRSATASTGAN